MAKAAVKLVANPIVKFSEESHLYYDDDFNFYRGITGLLSEQLFSDMYAAIPPEVLANAAAKGSRIHKILEDFDNGEECEACIQLDNYIKICEDNGLVIEASEYLVSDNVTWASCIDKVYRTGADTFSLADIKTTSTLHTDSVCWQLSIYAYLFELQNPSAKVDKLYAIWLRDGKSRFVQVPRIDGKIIRKLLDCGRDGTQFTIPPNIVINIKY